MDDLAKHHDDILSNGFTTIDNIYSQDEIDRLIFAIENTDKSNPAFRQTDDLFAIRQFLKEVSCVVEVIFNGRLRHLIGELFGDKYFVTKSIYFDKPERSNWFVAWHQDLTISVDKKIEILGYGSWTNKRNQFAVQPPLQILEDNFTIRIHLDDTNEDNGTLKVIPGSHIKDVYRPETIDWNIETESICNVNAGGVMIMKPLLLHASNRSTNNFKRRVIHLEFSKFELPNELNWAERLAI